MLTKRNGTAACARASPDPQEHERRREPAWSKPELLESPVLGNLQREQGKEPGLMRKPRGEEGGEGFRPPHCPLLPPSHPDSCSALVIHWLPPPRLPNTTPIQFSPLPHPFDLIRPCTLQETYIKVRTVGDFAGQLEQGKEGAVQR